MDEENDDRQDLYNEFESEVVKHGNQEAFFDENDLIEIYDYASDLDNSIVKMEVLIYGAIHYPKSEALATRRAWFYSSFGDFETATEINKRVTGGGVLNEILDIRVTLPIDSPEVEQRLDKIIDATDDFDDESSIQLVDLCMEFGKVEWLAKNKDRIQAKCSFPQTFIYEFADGLEEEGELEKAAELFEELTMLEPFNLDFWQRLAVVQINMNDYESSLSSADYALAIEPSSVVAARIKGASLYQLNRDMDTVVELYTKVVNGPEVEESDVATLAAALVAVNRQKEAAALLKDYIPKHESPRTAINVLMVLDLDAAIPYVEKEIENVTMTENDAFIWAKEHVDHEQYYAASVILLTYQRIHGFILGYEFTFEICYNAERFKEIVDLYENSVYQELKDSPIPSITFPYVMSLIRLDNRTKALAAAKEALGKAEKFRDDQSGNKESLKSVISYSKGTTKCILTGYIVTLDNIIRALESPELIPTDDFDPLI
ncbi:MAG: hypothetical protein NC453_04765 [Muribaculum sp.]|nr:hypothetical protein [Muribaculum sp.]